jgi:hypothetical protein
MVYREKSRAQRHFGFAAPRCANGNKITPRAGSFAALHTLTYTHGQAHGTPRHVSSFASPVQLPGHAALHRVDAHQPKNLRPRRHS